MNAIIRVLFVDAVPPKGSAVNLFVQVEQTSWYNDQPYASIKTSQANRKRPHITRALFLPTKVSDFYTFALIVTCCYFMLSELGTIAIAALQLYEITSGDTL